MTKRIAVKWGIILGVAVCVWTLALHLLGWYTSDLSNGLVADQVAIALPVVVLFLALRELARGLGRAPTIKEALATGVLAGAVSIPISAGFLWIYHHYINPRWNELLIEHERLRLTNTGASAEEISRRVGAMTASGTDAAQFVGAIVGTLLISAVISILVWGLLRISFRTGPKVAK